MASLDATHTADCAPLRTSNRTTLQESAPGFPPPSYTTDRLDLPGHVLSRSLLRAAIAWGRSHTDLLNAALSAAVDVLESLHASAGNRLSGPSVGSRFFLLPWEMIISRLWLDRGHDSAYPSARVTHRYVPPTSDATRNRIVDMLFPEAAGPSPLSAAAAEEFMLDGVVGMPCLVREEPAGSRSRTDSRAKRSSTLNVLHHPRLPSVDFLPRTHRDRLDMRAARSASLEAHMCDASRKCCRQTSVQTEAAKRDCDDGHEDLCADPQDLPLVPKILSA